METRTEWWTVDAAGDPVTHGATKSDALANHHIRRIKAMQHVREMQQSGMASGVRVLDNPVGVFERRITTTVVDSEIEEL